MSVKFKKRSLLAMVRGKCHKFVLEGHRETLMMVLVSFLMVMDIALP